MDYLDFAVEISGTANAYRIRADSPFMAPAESVFELPYDERALDAVLDRVELAVLKGSGRRRTLQAAHLDLVREFGSTLFESLITEDVEEAYHDAYRRASELQDGLRIRLTIEPAELASLPWELLYDPRLRDFVSLSSSTPLVRHLRTANPAPPLSVTTPLRILGMVTSPPDLHSLDVAGEQDRIEATVQPLVSRGVVEIGWVEGGTWRNLQDAMFEGPWHVFHYIGHGAFDRNRGENVLAFENEAAGSYRAVSPTELGRLIERDHALRLVVLNACEGARGDEQDALSSTAAHLVYRSVPAVLAMQWEISDAAAIEFAGTFYHSISEGSPVDAAVADARLAVSMAVVDSLEWATPVLYMQTPDGQIFDITAPPETEKAATVIEEADTETAKTSDDADPDTTLVDETRPGSRGSPTAPVHAAAAAEERSIRPSGIPTATPRVLAISGMLMVLTWGVFVPPTWHSELLGIRFPAALIVVVLAAAGLWSRKWTWLVAAGAIGLVGLGLWMLQLLATGHVLDDLLSPETDGITNGLTFVGAILVLVAGLTERSLEAGGDRRSLPEART